MLTKAIKRRFPPTPERLARPFYRAWRGVATFATLIIVVASAVVKHGFNIVALYMYRHKPCRFIHLNTHTHTNQKQQAAYLLEQHDEGIPVVGKIEPGLSHMAFPSWSARGLPSHAVATQAVPLAMLGKDGGVGMDVAF